MFPSRSMRSRLAYMNSRSPDGNLSTRDHLLRAPLVVDLDRKSEIDRIFNSGGAGMFAKPQDYCSTSAQIPPVPSLTMRPTRAGGQLTDPIRIACRRGPGRAAERWDVPQNGKQAAQQDSRGRDVYQSDPPVPRLQSPGTPSGQARPDQRRVRAVPGPGRPAPGLGSHFHDEHVISFFKCCTHTYSKETFNSYIEN